MRTRRSALSSALQRQDGVSRESRNVGVNCRLSPWAYLFIGLSALLLMIHLHNECSTSSLNEQTLVAEKAEKATQVYLDIIKDVELGKFLGNGLVNLSFEAKIPKLGDGSYAIKFGEQEYLWYSANEMKAYRVLNEPPTIPGIPKLVWSCEVINNPYKTWEYEKLKEYLGERGVSSSKAKRLHKQKVLSIQILSLIPHMATPEGLHEISLFMRSLLQGLDFAHSRNILNGDITLHNAQFDNMTGIAHLFDWDEGRTFEPNTTAMSPYVNVEVPEEVGVLMPAHATVSAFDIYSCGIMLNRLLCGHSSCKGVPSTYKDDKRVSLGYDLVSLMLTEDPYQRPTARDLLNHDFVKE